MAFTEGSSAVAAPARAATRRSCFGGSCRGSAQHSVASWWLLYRTAGLKACAWDESGVGVGVNQNSFVEKSSSDP